MKKPLIIIVLIFSALGLFLESGQLIFLAQLGSKHTKTIVSTASMMSFAGLSVVLLTGLLLNRKIRIEKYLYLLCASLFIPEIVRKALSFYNGISNMLIFASSSPDSIIHYNFLYLGASLFSLITLLSIELFLIFQFFKIGYHIKSKISCVFPVLLLVNTTLSILIFESMKNNISSDYFAINYFNYITNEIIKFAYFAGTMFILTRKNDFQKKPKIANESLGDPAAMQKNNL